MVTRRVVLVYGPPGGGKSTYARSLGLPVVDVDDPQWHTVPDCDGSPGCGHEMAAIRAIRAIGRDPHAQAVVIRAASRPHSRRYWTRLLGGHDWPGTVITVPMIPTRSVALSRVLERNRPRPAMPRQIAAIHAWYATYRPDPEGIGNVSRAW